MTMQLLMNIDVPDVDKAVMFYTEALPLRVGRKFDDGFVELLGATCPIYLLKEEEGSTAAATTMQKRSYARHWCPVHMDFVVENIATAIKQALTAGAKQEVPLREEAYGKIAVFSDLFGHGFCLIEFNGQGYDSLL